MSQEDHQKNTLCAQSQELLQGPLRHTRTAALALGARAAGGGRRAAPQVNEACPSGGICGTVFYDANNNGIQDAGESGISGVSVTIFYTDDGTRTRSRSRPTGPGCTTSARRCHEADARSRLRYRQARTPSPADQGSRRHRGQRRSCGWPRQQRREGQLGRKRSHRTPAPTSDSHSRRSRILARERRDTGRTILRRGRLRRSPSAAKTYTKAQAIALLEQVGKDKTLTMFSSLVPAMLNVAIGNDSSCVASTITAGAGVDDHLRARRQRCTCRQLRLEDWRAAASPDGQLQQRHALRPASRLVCSIPR